MRTTFLTTLVCRRWEWLRLSHLWPARVKYFWSPGFAFVHNCRIFELFYEGFFPSRWGDLARVEGEVKEKNVLVVGIRHLQNFFAGIHIPARNWQCIRLE